MATNVSEDRLVKKGFKYSGKEFERKWSKGKAENLSEKSAQNISDAEEGKLPSLKQGKKKEPTVQQYKKKNQPVK